MKEAIKEPRNSKTKASATPGNVLSNNKFSVFCLALLILGLSSCKKESMLTSVPGNSTIAPATNATCDAPDRYEHEMMLHPKLRSQAEAIQKSALALQSTGTVTIPVVFHVVYNQSAQNISDAQLQSQIDVLNEDYNAANADKINVPSCFTPYIGNAMIQFVLAKQDPNGNASTGITRTATSVTSFSSDGSVCYTSLGGYDAWPTNHYLNIWVCNKTGAAGSSSYPWSGNPATDGIIVNCYYVGRTGTFTNNWNDQKGRTITHEVGHWLGLGHIWGDATCGDDLVSDTPTQQQANFGVPAFPHLSACSNNGSNGDMFMNYMDYTDDAARIMFSQGQVTRMLYYLNGTRGSILTSPGATAPGTSTTSAITCNTPGGLYVNTITANSSALNWSSTGAASYNVKYKPTSSTTWITVANTATSLKIGNLSSSTTYEFQVQGICSSTSVSAWSASVTFTTSAATVVCNVPAGLFASSISSGAATLNWTSSGAANYSIRYKLSGSTTWTTMSTSSISIAVSGLKASATYEFQVASICSSTSISSFSSSAFFNTPKAHGNIKI